jgi:hypothetical protein
MLHLHFKGEGPAQQATLGPAAHFRVAGNFIRNAESGEILARYENHFWNVGGKYFTRYDCREPVRIHFEDNEAGKTNVYGPFDSLWVADGSLYAGGKLFAKFVDQTLLWHDHQTDTYWPVMVLSTDRPAASGR